jgi:hypothetical protein
LLQNGIALASDLPDESVRRNFSWLTVLTWNYSADSRGLPSHDEYQSMIELEDSIQSGLEKQGLCMQAISKTGNGKKEWVYYIRDRDEFIVAFNSVMHGKHISLSPSTFIMILNGRN